MEFTKNYDMIKKLDECNEILKKEWLRFDSIYLKI